MKSEKGIKYIGISCVFYCYDSQGNLLLQKRTNKARDEHGRWDCGGGAMKFGETFEQTIKRELMEEYCVKPTKIQFVGVNNLLRIHKKNKTHWIAVVFAIKVDHRKVKLGDPEKIKKIGWFKPDKLPKPLHSMYLTHLQFVKDAGII